MNLSELELIERVKSPPNRELLQQGRKYQSKLRVFTDPLTLKDLELEQGWQAYKAHIGGIFDEKRTQRILKFTTYPLNVISITNDIVTDLQKVFDARNANFEINYPSESVERSFAPVLERLNLRAYFEEVGRPAIKSKPNIIVVVDKNEAGEPYLLAIGEDKLIGLDFTPKGSIKSIIFKHSEGSDELGDYKRIAHYCDEFYTVLEERGDSMQVLSQTAHKIGYCPAKFLLDRELHSKDLFNRFSPLAPLMGSLTEWQKFTTALSFAEHFETFNVIQKPHSECGNDLCTNGYIHHEEQRHADTGALLEYGYAERCTACEDRSLIGPGTVVEVELDEDGKADSRDVFKFIAPDIGGLEHIAKKLRELENYIKVNSVGFNNVLSKEAVNQVQIRGLMESKKKPLLALREVLNESYKWVVDTVARAMYGEHSIKCSADFGTEWYIVSEQEIIELFNSAKEAGMPDGLLKDLYLLLIETKYKTDPARKERQKILCELDPFPFDNIAVLKEKYYLGMVSRDHLKLKGNLERLVAQFERENGDIVAFGSETDLSHAEKVDYILIELNKYLTNESEQLGSSEETTPSGESENRGPSEQYS